MLGRILAVAQNTFREAIRNKILYALLFFAVLLILSSVAVAKLALYDEVRIIQDLGLAATSLFGIIIAVFVGVNLIHKEMDRKTIYLILARPIRREEFLVGRYLGTIETMAVIVGLMGLVLGFTVLMRGGQLRASLLQALFLVFLEIGVISAVAVLFSTFSSPFLSGLFTLLIFVAGRLVLDIRQLAQRFPPGLSRWLLDTAAAVLPNGRLFYVSGAVVQGQWRSIHGTFVTWAYLGQVTAYAVFYTALVLLLAALVFQRRDLT